MHLQRLGHQMQREQVHQKQLGQPLGPQREWQVQGFQRELQQEHLQTYRWVRGRGRYQIILRMARLEHFQINPLQLALLQTQKQVQGFQKRLRWEQQHRTYHPLPVQGLQKPKQAQAGQRHPLSLQTLAREQVDRTPPSERADQTLTAQPPVDQRYLSPSQTHQRVPHQIPPLPAPLPVDQIHQKQRGQGRQRQRGRGRQRERLLEPVQTSLFNCFSFQVCQ